ncbi:MAG: ferredoxin family protein [Planctomycetales bacterium]|nr:ferredoxin family protein [Planctomycetales bacterium]
MAYIVTDNCMDCMFTDCVTVCPVNCFYGSTNMIYINPDECIDCGACVPECPVEAIFAEADLPDAKKEWTAKNKEAITAGGLASITEKRDPLPTAEDKKKSLGF